MIGRVIAGIEHVLIDPTHAGGVRPELGFDTGGQAVFHKVQVFQNPAPRPIQIRPVVKNNVDERLLKHADAAYDLRVRNTHHRRGEWIGDLIFHHVGRLAGVVSRHDHLHVGQIRDRIQVDVNRRPNPGGNQDPGQQQDHELIANR